MYLLFLKKRKCLNKKGFTLVEVMVATFLSTVLFAGVYMTFVFGHKTSRHYSQNVKKRQQLRLALNWMTRELREAKDIFIVEEKDQVRVDFTKKKIGSVSYVWKNSGKDKGVLRRRAPLKDRILASGIDSFSIAYPTTKTLKFRIASGAEKQDQVFLKGQVTLRSQMPTMLAR